MRKCLSSLSNATIILTLRSGLFRLFILTLAERKSLPAKSTWDSTFILTRGWKLFEFLNILPWWTWTRIETETFDLNMLPRSPRGEATSRYQDYIDWYNPWNRTKFSTHGTELRHEFTNSYRTWLSRAQAGFIWSSATLLLNRLTSVVNVTLLGGLGHF